jgi:hypothetical protein
MGNESAEDAKAARAEAKFKKQEERSREAQQVHAENAAKARAVDDNTARLKGMRLAKEAADKDAEKAKRPVKGKREKPQPNAPGLIGPCVPRTVQHSFRARVPTRQTVG